jgi:L-ribulose-5-phosphate 4-epimerase
MSAVSTAGAAWSSSSRAACRTSPCATTTWSCSILATGEKVEGALNPSTDAPTHLALYRAWTEIGGICHTHSPFCHGVVAAGRALPCFGTTHADHFHGSIPLCRILTPEETAANYEAMTGAAIVETFRSLGLDPLAIPAVLQHHHAPFTWGQARPRRLHQQHRAGNVRPDRARHRPLNPDAAPLPQHLLDKHFLRKHGPRRYYGQKA